MSPARFKEASRLLVQLTALMLAVTLFALSGCAMDPSKYLANRLACTADKAEAHVLSTWVLFSIGAKIAAVDAAAVCGGDGGKSKP